MGSFEKLGILVIVVIIVMILTVAIYQWGGGTSDSLVPVGSGSLPAAVIPELNFQPNPGPQPVHPVPPIQEWIPGVPRFRIIEKNDIMWKLVVGWGLKDSFLVEIQKVNPALNMKNLKPGTKVTIPDPTSFVLQNRKPDIAPAEYRLYKVQSGDLLERIAEQHLGSKDRVKEILALNPGMKANNLRPGTNIKLPLK